MAQEEDVMEEKYRRLAELLHKAVEEEDEPYVFNAKEVEGIKMILKTVVYERDGLKYLETLLTIARWFSHTARGLKWAAILVGAILVIQSNFEKVLSWLRGG